MRDGGKLTANRGGHLPGPVAGGRYHAERGYSRHLRRQHLLQEGGGASGKDEQAAAAENDSAFPPRQSTESPWLRPGATSGGEALARRFRGGRAEAENGREQLGKGLRRSIHEEERKLGRHAAVSVSRGIVCRVAARFGSPGLKYFLEGNWRHIDLIFMNCIRPF